MKAKIERGIKISKNKDKGSYCYLCGKTNKGTKVLTISGKRKTFHLKCYFSWVEKRAKEFKEQLKYLKRYKNYMILEELQL